MLILLVTYASMSVANAEKSGLFAGIDIGTNLSQRANSTSNKFLGSIGTIIGYKQFFTPRIGLRYYGNLNVILLENNPSQVSKNFLTSINTSMNIDLLANVISTKNVDFGGFVGFRFGGNILIKKMSVDFIGSFDPDSYVEQIIYYNLGQIVIPVPIIYISDIELDANFEIAFSAGLRLNLEKQDACEFFYAMPLFQTKSLGIYDSSHIYNNYIIGLRYTHNFATRNR